MSSRESAKDGKRKRDPGSDEAAHVKVGESSVGKNACASAIWGIQLGPIRLILAIVDELMYQAKRTKKPAEEFVPPASYHSSFRDLLAPYIITPEKFGPSEVIRYSDKFTVLNDAYPKATIHILVMPRDKAKSKIHPVTALQDRAFADEVWKECDSVRTLVAKELKRRFGGERDWTKEIKMGVHANPSMNNMHIHVISRDMAGKAMKKRTHYSENSKHC